MAQLDDDLTPLTARWRSIEGDRIDWRRWDNGSGDEDFVVFNDMTADTHQLTGDAGAVLLALLAAPAPCTPGEVLVRVAGDTATVGALDAVGAILVGLERIGLASRVAT